MALEMMISNDDSIYLSAPTTPTTLCLENLNFYSAPTSPFPHAYNPTFDHDQTEPATPKSCTTCENHHDDYEDANNNFIEFEFETSRRFISDDYDFDQMERCFESPRQQKTKQEQHHQHKESLPAMAFADELFCDGKVMPLKPPPRLRNVNCNNSSSCLSSPKSPTASRRFPFSRRSLWNDDFDPFMVALENVIKNDNIEKRNKAKDHRRSRSMSPLRATSPQKPSKSMSFHHHEIKLHGPDQNNQMEPDGPHSIWSPYENRKMEKQSKENPLKLGESKGLLFARHTRLVKMGHEKASKQTQRGERGGKESEESFNNESRRQRMKKLLFKSASSIWRTNNEEKQKDQSDALPAKKCFTRKSSFMSTGNGIVQCNEEKRVAQATKVTVMQYTPKLFICMGYGAKYVK